MDEMQVDIQDRWFAFWCDDDVGIPYFFEERFWFGGHIKFLKAVVSCQPAVFSSRNWYENVKPHAVPGCGR